MRPHPTQHPKPDTNRWPHDELWNHQAYEDLYEDFVTRTSITLADLALSPAGAPDIHSDEWNLALLHALAQHLLSWCPPF